MWHRERNPSYLDRIERPAPLSLQGGSWGAQGSKWKVIPEWLVSIHLRNGHVVLPKTRSKHLGQWYFQKRALWNFHQKSLGPAPGSESRHHRYPGKYLCLSRSLSCLHPHRYPSDHHCGATWRRCDATHHHWGRMPYTVGASRGWWVPAECDPACLLGLAAGTRWWRQVQRRKIW